jgi:hypothetical protein
VNSVVCQPLSLAEKQVQCAVLKQRSRERERKKRRTTLCLLQKKSKKTTIRPTPNHFLLLKILSVADERAESPLLSGPLGCAYTNCAESRNNNKAQISFARKFVEPDGAGGCLSLVGQCAAGGTRLSFCSLSFGQHLQLHRNTFDSGRGAHFYPVFR